MTEETPDMASSRIAIGIDVGGSGIKAAVVDVESGRFRSERIRVATPSPSTPDAVLASVARVIKRLAKSSGLGDATPVGIGLPGVTIDGVLKSAANIDPAWIDFPVVERLTRVIGRPVTIINDADAAGIAEMRFGIGRDKPGVVIFLTLGTGVGSGVFVDGKLVPEHGVRPDGDPRSCRRATVRVGGAGRSAACPGRRGRPISTSISTGSTSSCGRTS